MSLITWILDPGHGGMCQLEYMNTPGKRSPEISPAFGGHLALGIYEGEFNRDVMMRVLGMALYAGVDAVPLVYGPENIPLKERVKRTNEIQRKKGECHLVSIHANAAGKGAQWNKARGFRILYSKKAGSKDLAVLMNSYCHTYLTQYTKARTPDPRNYTIFNVGMPAALAEFGFMTNKEDARAQASDEFRDRCALVIFETMMDYEFRY